MTQARVLVTGASGFIGRCVLDPLVATGATVHVVQRRGAVGVPVSIGVHHVDLHDARACDALVDGIAPTHLLHLAWIATPGVYVTSPDNPRWLQSSIHLIEAFIRRGGARLVTAGSAMEYDWTKGWCAEESTPCKPQTLYAACKHALYEVADRWSAQTNVSFAHARIFWLYGPGEAPERLIPAMIHAGMTGVPMMLRHPAQVRDYLHVADAGAAIAALLASDVRGPVNIASGEPIALERLAGLVSGALGTEVPIEHGAHLADPAPFVVARTQRLRQEVAFTPAFGILDGIRDAIAWWKAHDRWVRA